MMTMSLNYYCQTVEKLSMNTSKIAIFSLIISLNQQVMSTNIENLLNLEEMETTEDNQRGQKRTWDKIDFDEADSIENNSNQNFDLSQYFQKNKKQKIQYFTIIEHFSPLQMIVTSAPEKEILQEMPIQLRSLVFPGYLRNLDFFNKNS